MNWPMLAVVMSGGAFGAALRYLLGDWMLRQFGQALPWGTLTVNLLGSFFAGWLLIWLENRGDHAIYWRGFLLIGVLGALTTYSALMLESLLYLRNQQSTRMLVYLAITLIGGLLMVWVGARIGIWLRGDI